MVQHDLVKKIHLSDLIIYKKKKREVACVRQTRHDSNPDDNRRRAPSSLQQRWDETKQGILSFI